MRGKRPCCVRSGRRVSIAPPPTTPLPTDQGSVEPIPAHGDDRHQQDLEVEPQSPVLDVVVVPLDALGERGLAPKPVHLRPPRDPRLDAVAVLVAVYGFAESRGD